MVAVAVELSFVPSGGAGLLFINAGYTTVTLPPAGTLNPMNCKVWPAAHVVKPPTPSQYAAKDSSVRATVVLTGTTAVSATD